MGRWINRDPIDEKGGLNLYVFTDNNSVAGYDVLGNFSPKNHTEILTDAYKGKIKDKYLKLLIQQDHDVDILFQFMPAYHYDGNEIDAVNKMIENAFNKIKELDKGQGFSSNYPLEFRVRKVLNLSHFAGITHASADYWSHTNAVKLEQIPGLSERIGLISGIFILSNHLRPDIYDESFYDQITNNDGTLVGKYLLVWTMNFTHHQLNKDTLSTLEGRELVNGKSLHQWAKIYSVKSLLKRLETLKTIAPCIWSTIKVNEK